MSQEAHRAGLFSLEWLEKWIREQLKARPREELSAAMDRMAEVNESAVILPEAAAEEIASMLSERRIRLHG